MHSLQVCQFTRISEPGLCQRPWISFTSLSEYSLPDFLRQLTRVSVPALWHDSSICTDFHDFLCQLTRISVLSCSILCFSQRDFLRQLTGFSVSAYTIFCVSLPEFLCPTTVSNCCHCRLFEVVGTHQSQKSMALSTVVQNAHKPLSKGVADRTGRT